MTSINWLDFFILIFASFRITHFIVFDEITAFIRMPFISEVFKEDSSGNMEKYIEIKGAGLRAWIGKLLSCYWCTGFWSALGVVLIFIYFPIAFPILLVFAVAGAAAILESII
ncbi:DUF1360 domain-containing protein [Sporosarcina pasteurii]|uniref:Protein of uncharacterized function (DUF1360) n=1 Tax=Sporosarcina pasteurii TaxID=1474 RepID=A0A380BNF9_SPOPA|nr:DUF1360 domain-containing protein [Sporosarcina pasteurii]MDS9471060.1 DUF1360 domain-containing protein [Sporosarcina pasteurii]QBQ05296.1 DUF1360 domain-containing protein [Sporosarcina pasteurii]SUJ04198.1 Protein of uncharacterised function (DUF1360) [Sporosarcina pasteurii]